MYEKQKRLGNMSKAITSYSLIPTSKFPTDINSLSRILIGLDVLACVMHVVAENRDFLWCLTNIRQGIKVRKALKCNKDIKNNVLKSEV